MVVALLRKPVQRIADGRFRPQTVCRAEFLE